MAPQRGIVTHIVRDGLTSRDRLVRWRWVAEWNLGWLS
jgi:hypothetical protein